MNLFMETWPLFKKNFMFVHRLEGSSTRKA